MADIRLRVALGGSVSYLHFSMACDNSTFSLKQIGQIPYIDKFLTKSPLYVAFAPTHPVVKFTVERIKERISAKAKGDDKRRDFLTRCFEAQEKSPGLVTDRIIRMWNIDNILAGSDTTGISLRSVRSSSLESIIAAN